jgi:hypothetical protein
VRTTGGTIAHTIPSGAGKTHEWFAVARDCDHETITERMLAR